MPIRGLTAVLLAIGSLFAAGAVRAQEILSQYSPIPDSAIVRQQPYHRFFTQDRFGRRIVFYLSDEPRNAAPLPLVVYIQGSGSQSLFVEVNGRLQGRGGHSAVADVVRGRARLVIVEKPGVMFLDAPSDAGGATGASAAFRSEHTLERWSEAVHAAIEATLKLPGIRGGPVLVVGHSEGGLVAAKVGADYKWITHVAVLAGGGPTQLFDLIALARRGEFFRDVSVNPEERVAYVLRQWREILQDPESAEKLFFGHPDRRWSSFLQTSTLEQLLRTESRIYVAQGAEDRAVARESFEILRAGLLARGRVAQFDLVPGADHSFVIDAAGEHTDGWTALFRRVLSWFLNQ